MYEHVVLAAAPAFGSSANTGFSFGKPASTTAGFSFSTPTSGFSAPQASTVSFCYNPKKEIVFRSSPVNSFVCLLFLLLSLRYKGNYSKSNF